MSYPNVLEKFNEYLPVSGGNMNGRLNYNIAGDAVALCGNNYGTTRLVLRSDLSNKGAFLNLYGANFSDTAITNGGFQLCACSTGSDYKVLLGSVDGTLQWIGKDVVCVARWTSGTSGYRKYSDGFIEQWGRSTTSGNAVITLPLAFSNTNYNLTVGGGHSGGAWAYGNIINTTQIQVGLRGTQSFTQPTHWFACGY